jgi:urease accessory protein
MSTIPRATRVERAHAAMAIADVVRLDHDMRHRRRVRLTGEGGLALLLDLPAATTLRHGDALVLEDGRRVRVEARPEQLAELTCADAKALVRVAWHLGNRHLPTMIDGERGRLLIRRDHVIEEMARGLGARVAHIEAPFDPEGGAYGGHGHHHAHHHHE